MNVRQVNLSGEIPSDGDKMVSKRKLERATYASIATSNAVMEPQSQELGGQCNIGFYQLRNICAGELD
jgi:hypothetical protein